MIRVPRKSPRAAKALAEPHDPERGEVPGPRPPARRQRTPEQIAEANRIRAERDELRRQELAAIRALDPACEADGDPPVKARAPARMGGEPSGVLLRKPRQSARGASGSHLIAAARSYDGAGPSGGMPREYVSVFVTYRDRGAYEWRTPGVALYEDEIRPLLAALSAYADERGLP
jgi:hypothetical protein